MKRYKIHKYQDGKSAQDSTYVAQDSTSTVLSPRKMNLNPHDNLTEAREKGMYPIDPENGYYVGYTPDTTSRLGGYYKYVPATDSTKAKRERVPTKQLYQDRSGKFYTQDAFGNYSELTRDELKQIKKQDTNRVIVNNFDNQYGTHEKNNEIYNRLRTPKKSEIKSPYDRYKHATNVDPYVVVRVSNPDAIKRNNDNPISKRKEYVTRLADDEYYEPITEGRVMRRSEAKYRNFDEFNNVPRRAYTFRSKERSDKNKDVSSVNYPDNLETATDSTNYQTEYNVIMKTIKNDALRAAAIDGLNKRYANLTEGQKLKDKNNISAVQDSTFRGEKYANALDSANAFLQSDSTDILPDSARAKLIESNKNLTLPGDKRPSNQSDYGVTSGSANLDKATVGNATSDEKETTSNKPVTDNTGKPKPKTKPKQSKPKTVPVEVKEPNIKDRVKLETTALASPKRYVNISKPTLPTTFEGKRHVADGQEKLRLAQTKQFQNYTQMLNAERRRKARMK